MAIVIPGGTIRPNSQNGGTDPLALVIEEYTGIVENTIQRKSVTEGKVPIRTVRGTATITNFAVGESTLGKVTVGEVPEALPSKFSKTSVTVDTVIYARTAFPLLDVFQTSFDARKEVGTEHGKKIAKFKDQALLIQAAKAAQLTASPYANVDGVPDGFTGGSTQTLAAAGDRADPAKLYSAIAGLFTKMEQKDVDPVSDDLMLVLTPADYYTLLQAEQIVNGEWLTSDGTSIQGHIFRGFGVPVISTNNLPQTNITTHLLGTAYTGDFTKLVACAFSARALLAGQTIPLETDVWYDKMSKQWLVDAHLAFNCGPNRPEYAGAILLP